ncbi:hypothetical protein [Dokdonella sp.]|uniref:hypothetical protein n=1 Tax=Dokdonella sp. TaxID=2291710 RepID=UPI002F3F4FE2
MNGASGSRIHFHISWVARATIVAATAFGSRAALAMLTVGPASDGACQYHDLGAAVAAAAQSPGFDLIAVSGGPWTAQTSIVDHDPDGLTIEGGYANCSAGLSSGRTTLDGAGAQPAGPLFVHSGNGPLTLRHLVLQNAAGGIQSVVAGPLTLADVIVYSNHADYGGGLFVSGNDIFRPQLNLIGSSINSNSATVNGGGLYLNRVDVSITGGSNIVGNIAQGGAGTSDGGGIYAIDSNIVFNDHSVASIPTIGNNYAQRNGGGVYFSTTRAGAYEILLWNDLANAPIVVDHNAAQNQGGAFYLSSIASGPQIFSFAGLENVQVTNNESYEGAAFYAFSSGASASVGTLVQMGQSMPGDAIPACSRGIACNTIDDNHAVGGSVVQMSSAGDSGHSSFILHRGRMRGNRGGALVGGNGYIDIDSSLVADNTIDGGGSLMYDISADLLVTNCTIANNLVAGGDLFVVAIPPASLSILHSLLVQPSTAPVTGYDAGNGVAVTVRDIGAMNVGITGTNVQFLTDPFVDGGNGDYHIRDTSSAVDRWGPSGDPNDVPPALDLDGALRPYQHNSASTPYDFGCYEADAIVDPIFIDGFDT